MTTQQWQGFMKRRAERAKNCRVRIDTSPPVYVDTSHVLTWAEIERRRKNESVKAT